MAEGIQKGAVCVVNFNVATRIVPYASSTYENPSFAGRDVVIVVNSAGFGYRPFFGEIPIVLLGRSTYKHSEGKAKGKETLEKLIVEALKSASEKSKVGRDEAQKDMMKYISDSMKKMGAM